MHSWVHFNNVDRFSSLISIQIIARLWGVTMILKAYTNVLKLSLTAFAFEIVLRYHAWDRIDDRSALIQVIAWLRRAAIHHQNQCRLRSALWMIWYVSAQIYRSPNARLQYLQCVRNWDTAVLH